MDINDVSIDFEGNQNGELDSYREEQPCHCGKDYGHPGDHRIVCGRLECQRFDRCAHS